MNSIGEFCLVNLIGFVRFFMDSSCLGGSGRISVDSLKGSVYLEDRYKFIQGASAHTAGPVYGFVSLWCVGLISFSFCDQILCEKPTCEDRFQILFISCKIQPGASKKLPKWSQKGPTWIPKGHKRSPKGPTLTKRAPKVDQKT